MKTTITIPACTGEHLTRSYGWDSFKELETQYQRVQF